jgi:hypothetical protein
MATKKHLFSWIKYATAKLISAVIANTAKANIVLTFTDIKPFKNCVYTEFSVTGTAKTVDSRTLSYTNNRVTVHVTVDYAYGNTCNLVYNPPNKGATISIPVTNNVAQ